MSWKMILIGLIAFVALFPQTIFAQIGRFQIIAADKPLGAILIDTTTGCAWRIAQIPNSNNLWFVFLPREGLPPGSDKSAAMIPKECASFEGVIPGRYWEGNGPTDKNITK